MDPQDMIDMQLDVFDITANQSLGFMTQNVRNGQEKTLNTLYKDKAQKDKVAKKIEKVFNIFKTWNHEFDLESIGGSIWNAWELATASYFQQAKIDNMDVRRCLSSNIAIDNFLYREIEHWSWEKETFR